MRHGFMVALLFLGACGSEGGEPIQSGLTHEFPPVELAAGQEVAQLCQSWTIGNDEPLAVNRVELTAGPGWHHSNWMFVPDNTFTGPDGVWPCEERGFDEVTAAIVGGVLTAQSTQAPLDVQQFAPGHALVMPARARIIGATHALNVRDTVVSTQLGLRLETIPAAKVTKRLQGLSFVNRSLALPPMARSRFSTRCDMGQKYPDAVGRPIDFRLYYVLPHHHALGEGLTLSAIGGAHDGEVIFASHNQVGEPGGGALDPPFDLTGATGLEMTCAYANPRDEVVGWGIGDQEMCVLLAFTDADVIIAGGALNFDDNVEMGQDAEGVYLNEAPCQPFFILPRE